MKLIKEIPFEHKGIKYVVKVFETDNGYLVRAFKDNLFANCYVYQVEYSTNYDFLTDHGKDAYVQLIETAKNDVINQ